MVPPLLMLFALCITFQVNCYGKDINGNASRLLNQEVLGLTIDATSTAVGNSFYQAFSSQWQMRREARRYNLVLLEEPNGHRGTRILIQARGQDLYRATLSNNRVDIDSLVLSSVGSVIAYLRRQEFKNWNEVHSELANDEYRF